MIQIMANENMEEWTTEVQVIDETIRATKKFLGKHPEEIANPGWRKEKYRRKKIVSIPKHTKPNGLIWGD